MKPQSVAKKNRRQLSDLDLLKIQAKMSLNQNGLIAGYWGIKIATACEGQLLFLGSELPRQLADAVQATFEAIPSEADPTVAFAKCERILKDATGPIVSTSGPSYVIPNNTRFTSPAKLVLSQSQQAETVRQGNPGNWLPDEWNDLIDGKLGPWAIAMIGERVISICHTPKKMTVDAAECGVWTDPDFRGQGHAAATTAAWASILEPTRRHLFYSTDAENRSSQSVATRLNLRNIGSTWKLTKPCNSSENRK